MSAGPMILPKFSVVLNDSGLDYRRIRPFLEWLCSREDIQAYAYVTHVGKVADPEQQVQISEGVDIYASSEEMDVSICLDVSRSADGSLTYERGATHCGKP